MLIFRFIFLFWVTTERHFKCTRTLHAEKTEGKEEPKAQ